VQLPGTTSRAGALRHVDLTRAWYRDEAWLYEVCRRDQIDYVVYSIDVMLDGGPYSPSNLAAVSALDPSSIAARMHFDPESLRHFTLMYENDHYRLFRVTASPQPVFLTDHPLFYQPDLFARDGSDLEHFRSHVVWLMGTYANALNARARGDAEAARRMLDMCVRQAPKFTRARLALADALMDLGLYEAARDQIAAVIQYAPDNPTALYSAAFVQVQLNDPDGARPFLALLAQIGDAATLEKARALQYYIENKIPLKPGAPQ
jgi:tetratricopeptide (TPR) repeat protein